MLMRSVCTIFALKIEHSMDRIADAISEEYLDLLRTLSDLNHADGESQDELMHQVTGKEERIQKLMLLSKKRP